MDERNCFKLMEIGTQRLDGVCRPWKHTQQNTHCPFDDLVVFDVVGLLAVTTKGMIGSSRMEIEVLLNRKPAFKDGEIILVLEIALVETTTYSISNKRV